MSEMEQKPQGFIENVEKQLENNGKMLGGITGKGFMPGQSGNPGGRPTGALNFATKWRIFIDKVAKQNNITPDEVDEQLLAVAFKQAKEANYPFWRDIQDRVYGKPVESFILGGENGEPIKLDVTIQTAIDKIYGNSNSSSVSK